MVLARERGWLGERVWVEIEGIQVQRDFSILIANSIGFQDALLYIHVHGCWECGGWYSRSTLVLAGKGYRLFLIETNTEGPLRKKHQRNSDDPTKLVTKCDWV